MNPERRKLNGASLSPISRKLKSKILKISNFAREKIFENVFYVCCGYHSVLSLGFAVCVYIRVCA